MTAGTKRILLYGAGGVAVLVALFWIMRQQSGAAASANAPNAHGNTTFNVQGFTVPPLNFNANALANPGSTVIFDFTPPPVPPQLSLPGSGQGALTAGAGSADGSTGPCNCPQQSTASFGSNGALAQAVGPLLQLIQGFFPSSVQPFEGVATGTNKPVEAALRHAADLAWQWNYAAENMWSSETTG